MDYVTELMLLEWNKQEQERKKKYGLLSGQRSQNQEFTGK